MHIGSTAIRMSGQTSVSFLNLDDRTVQIQLNSETIRCARAQSLRRQRLPFPSPILLSTAPGAPLTAHFPLRLTALDSSAYSPFRDPTPPSDRPDRIGVFETEGARRFIKDRFRFMARGNFGDRLKRERELREVSIEELTKATRIRRPFCRSLENEDWGRLPGGVFGHGSCAPSHAIWASMKKLSSANTILPARIIWRQLPQTRGTHSVAAEVASRSGRFPLLILVVGLSIPPATAGIATLPIAPPKIRRCFLVRANLSLNSVSTSPGSAEQSSSAALLDLSVSTSAATRVRILADNKLLLDAECPPGEPSLFGQSAIRGDRGDSFPRCCWNLNGKAMPPSARPALGTMVLTSEGLEAIIRWKLSVPKFSKICAAAAPRANEKSPYAPAVAHLAPRNARKFSPFLPATPTKSLAARAQDALLSQPIESFVEALKREQALHALFSYAAKNLADSPAFATPWCKTKTVLPITCSCRSPSLALASGADGRTRSRNCISRAGRRSEHSSSLTVDQKNQLHELHGPENLIDETRARRSRSCG